MNKLKRIMMSIAFVLLVVDPLGYMIWEYDTYIAYAYEFKVWKYKIIYNPVVEQEVVPTFTETHIFNEYVNEYNKQERLNSIVAELDYERIGIINTDNNFIYTIYIDEQGKITKVVNGFDDVDFIAKLSIKRIKSLTEQGRFEDLPNEIKLPFKVKLKILKALWF